MGTEYKSEIESRKGTPYLCFWENFGENLLRYNGTALYMLLNPLRTDNL